MNYITHFAVFRRDLLRHLLAGLSLNTEGCAGPRPIVKVHRANRPHRAHSEGFSITGGMGHNSSASSAAAKPLASENGRRAIEDALPAPRPRGFGGSPVYG